MDWRGKAEDGEFLAGLLFGDKRNKEKKGGGGKKESCVTKIYAISLCRIFGKEEFSSIERKESKLQERVGYLKGERKATAKGNIMNAPKCKRITEEDYFRKCKR